MLFELNQQHFVVIVFVALAIGCAVLALALPLVGSSALDARIRSIANNRRAVDRDNQASLSRLIDGRKDDRRKRVQDSLKQVDARAAPRWRGVPLRTQIGRAGLGISVRRFWVLSAGLGIVTAMVPTLLGFPLFIGLLSGVVGFLGVPRWLLHAAAKRRQRAFLEGLADAVDVIIRGLRAGLPLSEALRVIATETTPPVGPEFMEVVQGQRLGITVDQGLERMFERMPLPEVSFLGIVIAIQSKAGGNLAEALGNLSKVLRDRKKMKAKVKSMAQEAKSSATIIGILPFCVIGALFAADPDYLKPLLETGTGHMILLGCGVWMLIGLLLMRKMINFEV